MSLRAEPSCPDCRQLRTVAANAVRDAQSAFRLVECPPPGTIAHALARAETAEAEVRRLRKNALKGLRDRARTAEMLRSRIRRLGAVNEQLRRELAELLAMMPAGEGEL